MSTCTRYRVRRAVEPPIPDAPGYDLKPDPAHVRTVAELADALERLRRWAGAPSLREISGRCEHGLPSHSAFHVMLRGDRLPAMDQVLVFVTALGLHDDLPQWADAWCRVAFLRSQQTSGAKRRRRGVKMLPSNPLMLVYILGAYGWAALLLFALVVRPMAFGMLLRDADRAGMSRGVVIALMLVAYTVAWPVTAAVILATGRRN